MLTFVGRARRFAPLPALLGIMMMPPAHAADPVLLHAAGSLRGALTDVASAFEVVAQPWPADDQPFRWDTTPIQLKARARQIPAWTLDAKGLVQESLLRLRSR